MKIGYFRLLFFVLVFGKFKEKILDFLKLWLMVVGAINGKIIKILVYWYSGIFYFDN